MAFELDDLDPRNAKKKPVNLDDMNIEDLTKIKAKQSHASAAATFFKR